MIRPSRQQSLRRGARKLKLFNLFSSKFERGEIDKATFLARAPETELTDEPPIGVSAVELRTELERRRASGSQPTALPVTPAPSVLAASIAPKPVRTDVVLFTGQLSRHSIRKGRE